MIHYQKKIASPLKFLLLIWLNIFSFHDSASVLKTRLGLAFQFYTVQSGLHRLSIVHCTWYTVPVLCIGNLPGGPQHLPLPEWAPP